jgi:hypothetical protein
MWLLFQDINCIVRLVRCSRFKVVSPRLVRRPRIFLLKIKYGEDETELDSLNNLFKPPRLHSSGFKDLLYCVRTPVFNINLQQTLSSNRLE